MKNTLLASAVLGLSLGLSSHLLADETSAMQPVPWDYEYLTVHEEEFGKTEANIKTMDKIFAAIYTQDWEVMRELYADNYVQHNPDMNDGKEGVIELFESLDYETMVYETVLRIAEGPYVIALSRFQAAPDQPEMAALDINFIRDGQSREHWDILMPVKGKNPAEHTLFDIAITDVEVDRATENANKQLVADMINEVLNRKQVDRVEHYFGETYYQHGMGNDGREAVVKDITERFPDAEVDIKRIIAENDLVLAHSRVTAGGKDFSRGDIWRVRNAKLVEHWGVMQPVPDTMKHRNGMF